MEQGQTFQMDVTQGNSFKKGDFVFAKIKGYRAWPARILQSVGQKHNVFFYGTCNTAMIAVQHLSPYELVKSRLGDPKQLRQKEFKRAVLHAELMVAHPTEDTAYYYNLEKVAKDSSQADVIEYIELSDSDSNSDNDDVDDDYDGDNDDDYDDDNDDDYDDD